MLFVHAGSHLLFYVVALKEKQLLFPIRLLCWSLKPVLHIQKTNHPIILPYFTSLMLKNTLCISVPCHIL